MDLSDLKRMSPRKKARKRVGRGSGSGHGKTSGRGHKGAGSRSGFGGRARFEGGQTPLYRRLPKRGFNNPWRKEFAPVNVGMLELFEDGGIVGPPELRAKGIARNPKHGIKILGTGQLTRCLEVRAHGFSKSAAEKITAAGGKMVLLKRTGGKDVVVTEGDAPPKETPPALDDVAPVVSDEPAGAAPREQK